MSDTNPSASTVVYGVFDGSRALPAPITAADAGASGDLIRSTPAHPLPTHTPSPLPLAASPPGDGNPKKKGAVLLNANALRELRESRMLSQQEMANLFAERLTEMAGGRTTRPPQLAASRLPARYSGNDRTRPIRQLRPPAPGASAGIACLFLH